MKKRTTFLAALFSLAISVQPQGLRWHTHLAQSVGFSFNPLGMISDTRLHLETPLSSRKGLLWESTKFEAGVQNEWTPADNTAMIRLAIEPIAFFDLVLKAGFYNMFDGLGYGCFRMHDATQGYGPDDHKGSDLADANGYWVSFTPTIKAKAGRFIVLNSFTINRISLDTEGFFLEVRSYLPHKSSGFDMINSTYALAELNHSALFGMNYQYARVVETRAQSQRITAIALLKAAETTILKGTYAVICAGQYTDDRLFGGKPYIAALAGWETVLAVRDNGRKRS